MLAVGRELVEAFLAAAFLAPFAGQQLLGLEAAQQGIKRALIDVEAEIDEESWIVEPALPEDVFTADPEGLWSDVLRRKGGPFSVLALMPPDPSSN